jgi:glycosyltransferase domain-containing protein
MSHERITCLGPTHNRPQFLRRLLTYYSVFWPEFSFLVVDSSGRQAAAENNSAIERFRRTLKIEYRHFASDYMSKCINALGLVRTPFVVFCADDDLLIPDSVGKCVEFLEVEEGFATVQGRTALLNTTRSTWHRRLKILKGYSIDQNCPLDRCHRIASNFFSNLYAVHRTKCLLDNFRIAAANMDLNSSPHLAEALLLQMSVLRGRVKVLPLMYSIWQRHGENASTQNQSGLEPEAELHYQRSKGTLRRQMTSEGIDQSDAECFIDDWYGHCRNPELASWRRCVSMKERFRRIMTGLVERMEDLVSLDRVRHCRSIRLSDLVGCESTWQAAVKLISDFPQGIPEESALLKRSA